MFYEGIPPGMLDMFNRFAGTAIEVVSRIPAMTVDLVASWVGIWEARVKGDRVTLRKKTGEGH